MSIKTWSNYQLVKAVNESYSYRQVIIKLGLKPAGGNYKQIQKYINELKIDCSHFTGKGWNKGLKFTFGKSIPLDEILIENSNYQSHKLKKRLFKLGIKSQECEECGWKEISSDGRIPLELDHINGNHKDNRIENSRILCPNCHSLKTSHRGKNRHNRL